MTPTTNDLWLLIGSAKLCIDRALRLNPRGLSAEEHDRLLEIEEDLAAILAVEDPTAA